MAHLPAQFHFADVGGAFGHQREEGDLALFGRGQKELLIERGHHRNAEDGTRRSAQAFRIVRADGAFEECHAGGAECLCRPQNRAGIARVLQSIQRPQ